MTRQEREKAIKTLQKLQADYNDKYIDYEGANEAFRMAIQALQTEPCEDAISRAEAINVLDALYLDGESAQGFTADANEDCLIGKYKAIEILDNLPSVNPVCEPCDDAISRQTAIDAAIESADKWDGGFSIERSRIITKALNELPAVQPEQKTGHCKDCKWWKDSDGAYRRGIGAESQCPINSRKVFEGNGYCYMFAPQESEDI